MARFVTVSALGPPALHIDPNSDNAEAISMMQAHWREQIERVLPDEPDLIVLPEACDRPANFTMERRLQYYEARGEQIREAVAAIACEGNCNIAYSAARIMEDGTYRNMTEVLDRKGNGVGSYSKNHLVPVEYDDAGIMYGTEPSLIKLDFGTVSPAICFDLNYGLLGCVLLSCERNDMTIGDILHEFTIIKVDAYFDNCRAHRLKYANL